MFQHLPEPLIALEQDTTGRATPGELVELYAGLVEIRDRVVAEHGQVPRSVT